MDSRHDAALVKPPRLPCQWGQVRDVGRVTARVVGVALAAGSETTTLAAQELHRQGRSAGITEFALSPLVRFIKFYFFRLGLLDGLPGLIHISIGCMNSFMKYAKLAELRQAERK